MRKKNTPWLVALFFILGVLNQGPLLFKEPFGRVLVYKGYSYQLLGQIFGRFMEPFPQEARSIWEVLKKYKEDDRRTLYHAFSGAYLSREDRPIEWGHLLKSWKGLAAPYRYSFLRALGVFLGRQGEEAKKDLKQLIEECSEEEKGYVYEGLASAGISTLPRRYQYLYYFYLSQRFQLDAFYSDSKQPVKKEVLLKKSDPSGLKWEYRGMGAAFSFLYNWGGIIFKKPSRFFQATLPRSPLNTGKIFIGGWGGDWGRSFQRTDRERWIAFRGFPRKGSMRPSRACKFIADITVLGLHNDSFSIGRLVYRISLIRSAGRARRAFEPFSTMGR